MSPCNAPIRHLLAASTGNVAVITALFAPVLALMAALAIDTGALSTQRRALQGYADMAALAAASDLSDAEEAARTVLRDNGRSQVPTDWEGDDEMSATDGIFVSVQTGRYVADKGIVPDQRFVAGGEPVNAARVSLREAPRHYFGFLNNNAPTMEVAGTAFLSSEAAMSVGSRLARLDEGLLNALLEELTGAQVSLSAMSYEALLETDIDMLESLEWLASDLSLTALTYEEVLETDIGVEDLLEAMAQSAGENVLARQALRALDPEESPEGLTLKVGDLIELGRTGPAELGHPPPGAGVRMKAMPLLMAGLILANSENHIDLDLSSGVEGIYDVDASLMIGERPAGRAWYAVSGVPGQPVSTTQLRLSVIAQASGGYLFPDAHIRLPLHIDLASAEAQITDIVCNPNEREARRVDVAVHPSIARLRIAELPDPGDGTRDEPVDLLQGRLVRVSGYADVEAANPDPSRLSFLRHEIGEDPKTAGTDKALEGLLASALSTLDLEIDVLGLSSFSENLLKVRLIGLVEELARPLDRLIFNLTASLGLGLGEADVWIHSAKCNAPVLVQ